MNDVLSILSALTVAGFVPSGAAASTERSGENKGFPLAEVEVVEKGGNSSHIAEGVQMTERGSTHLFILSGLPKGYGFQFELRLTDTTDNPSKPILDGLTLKFK